MAGGVDILRTEYKRSFEWLEGTMAECSSELIHKQPDGLPHSIAAQVAHVVTGVDFLLLGAVAGQQPLIMGAFAEKSGVSEPPPAGPMEEWAKRVQVDLKPFHEYAVAVFDALDTYLGGLSDDDLGRSVETPFGTNTVAEWLGIMLLNTYSHTGEISCLKGLNGLKGYPF